MDELLFVGIDIEKSTRKILNEKIDELGINDMTESERKAFDYGVNLVYQLIGIVTYLEDHEDFVVLTNDEEGTEYSLEELVNIAEEKEMIWTGKKVYDPLTNIWSSGYWIKDNIGNWYPVWNR